MNLTVVLSSLCFFLICIFFFQIPKTAEATITKLIAILAICGPNEPSKRSPSHEPTKPAIMFEI